MTEPNTQNGLFLYKKLLSVSRRYWHMLLIGLLATIFVSTIDSAITWFLKPVIDKGFIDRSVSFIRWLPLVIVLGFLLRSISGFFSSYCVSYASRHVVQDFRQQLFAKYLKLPVDTFDKSHSGRFISTIIYNVDQVSSSTSQMLLMFLRETTFMIGLLVVMFMVSWRLSLLFFLVTPVVYYILRYTSRRIRKLSSGIQDSMADVTKVVDRGVRGCREIRLNGTIKKERDYYNKITRLTRHKEMKVVVTNAMNSSLTQLLLGLPIALILYIAVNPNMHISAGAFASVVVAMISLQRPLKRLMAANSTLQKGIAAAASIFDALDLTEEEDNGSRAIETRVRGEIVLEQVSFRYPGCQQWALKKIQLHIQAGMTVALVGRSGAGKSTLASLLPRFFNPQEGVIKIDGCDIKEYSLADLRSQFAFVSQNAMIFDGTVEHNLTYGVVDRQVSEAEIIDAAERACAMEFIQGLQGGMQALVGSDGVLLSGGQQQRLVIARALLRDAPILVFDEATSALDSESENLIQHALKNLFEQRTTIVIAHRLSTIQSADLIVVVDDGCIVETGTHQALQDADGVYAHLCRLQFDAVEA